MQYNKKYRWIYLGLIVIIIRFVVGFFPQIVEIVYSRGIFLAIRWLIDNTTARLPFPILYIFMGIIGWLMVRVSRHWLLLFRQKQLQRKDILLPIANFFSITIVLFLFLWGFNYAREPLENQLQLNTQNLNLQQIIKETEKATNVAKVARQQILNADTNALTHDFLPPNLEDTMRQLLVKVLKKYNYPTVGKMRGRMIYPKGFLMRLGASGIYLPWIGEGQVDGALTAAQLPFTMAHELAHGYGFGDEGSCNFWGYLACMASDNPMIRYSGELTYWRYIAAEYKYFKPEDYEIFRAENLSRGMDNDLALMYNNRDKYPTIIPFQNQAYDTYLKFQGVEEGIESYSRMVLLVKAWKSRK
ncbi:MAG: DUF3810 domain-containing protein [Saprospiraceae bacterium]